MIVGFIGYGKILPGVGLDHPDQIPQRRQQIDIEGQPIDDGHKIVEVHTDKARRVLGSKLLKEMIDITIT